jgi:PAS domain-containing protein
MASEQKPLELILARNLLTSLSTPAFLADEDGALVFYNEAAGQLLGLAFEESGKLDPREWSEKYGPFDAEGKPIGVEQLPITRALRDGRPAHAEYTIRSSTGGAREVEVSALPIVANGGKRGAMVVFWPKDGVPGEPSSNGSHQSNGAGGIS